jgi:hypothetical protein
MALGGAIAMSDRRYRLKKAASTAAAMQGASA